MSQNHTVDDPAVLYVDDEAQALKYFARSFGDDFRILTAENADDAELLVNGGTEHIGIVISDQRMPGRTGASLLSALRANHPQIVRLVTTAYSDLESAIESVNSGEVLRYIVKPWDIDALRLDLKTAMRIYQLQREREELLAEKLSVQQSITAVDRLRTLIVACAGLKPYPHAVWSACRYGEDLGRLAQFNKSSVKPTLDLWQQAEAETLQLSDTIATLADMPAPPGQVDADTSILDALTESLGKLPASTGSDVLQLPAVSQLASAKIPKAWLADVFANAIEGMQDLTENLALSAQTGDDTKTTITLSGNRRTDLTLPVLFSEPSNDEASRSTALLRSYLMAGETSGQISLKGNAGKLILSIVLGGQANACDGKNTSQKINQSFRSFETWPQ